MVNDVMARGPISCWLLSWLGAGVWEVGDKRPVGLSLSRKVELCASSCKQSWSLTWMAKGQLSGGHSSIVNALRSPAVKE